MKISSISNLQNRNYNYNNTAKQQPKFNGLWLRTTSKTDFDCALCIPQTTTIRYYSPFDDETASDIKEVIEQRKSAEIIEDERGNMRYILNDCKLCSRLPFTKKQYEAYMNIKTQPTRNLDLLAIIRSSVNNKYRNDSIHKLQIPAANPLVS